MTFLRVSPHEVVALSGAADQQPVGWCCSESHPEHAGSASPVDRGFQALWIPVSREEQWPVVAFLSRRRPPRSDSAQLCAARRQPLKVALFHREGLVEPQLSRAVQENALETGGRKAGVCPGLWGGWEAPWGRQRLTWRE